MALRAALLVGLLLHAHATSCPNGWTVSETRSGKCYALIKADFISLFDGVVACRNLTTGADVVAIGNTFENEELASFLQTNAVDS